MYRCIFRLFCPYTHTNTHHTHRHSQNFILSEVTSLILGGLFATLCRQYPVGAFLPINIYESISIKYSQIDHLYSPPISTLMNAYLHSPILPYIPFATLFDFGFDFGLCSGKRKIFIEKYIHRTFDSIFISLSRSLSHSHSLGSRILFINSILMKTKNKKLNEKRKGNK